MIYREDIIGKKTFDDSLEDNLSDLLVKINQIEDLYGKKFTVTSGWRSKEDQLRIYAEKGITDTSKIPMQSKHFYCQAVDIYDPNRELQKWVKENLRQVEAIGLWMEDFGSTKNWVHFQTVAPKSGNRFFIP